MNDSRILIVEDNRDLATQLIDTLEAAGFIVDYAACGKDARNLFNEQDFDLVLLDWMLPDAEGIELCREIKQQSERDIPVLMLTARDSIDDKGTGFDAGADDYLTKPYELAEVVMRCQALSRRKQLHREHKLCIGELSIDTRSKSVERGGQSISLSATDYRILEILAREYPRAIGRQELSSRIWGEREVDDGALRTHMYTLRNAVDKPFASAMIKTIRGLGFRIECHETQ